MTIAEHRSGFHRVRKAWRLWLTVFVAAVVVVSVGLWLESLRDDGPVDQAYDSTSTEAHGSAAVVNVLRQRGTDVRRVEEIPDPSGSENSTVLVTTEFDLTEKDVSRLKRHRGDIVLLAPDSWLLEELSGRMRDSASSVDFTRTRQADCDVAPLASNHRIFSDYKIYDVPLAEAKTCFNIAGAGPDELGPLKGVRMAHSAYIQIPPGSPASKVEATLHIVGTPDVFSNSHIRFADNAAFAMNLANKHNVTYWYVPPRERDVPIFPELSDDEDVWPRAMAPLTWLAVITLFFAMLWRGRRFGRVVREVMPVHVSSSESVHGLATLYRRDGSHARAAELVRSATLRDIARLVGVGAASDRSVLIARIAEVTDQSRAKVVAVLDTEPESAAELSAYVERLDELSRYVVHCLRHGPKKTGGDDSST